MKTISPNCIRYALLAAVILLTSVPAQAQCTYDPAAANVIGQPDFTSNTNNNGGISASSLANPNSVAVDPTSGKLFVADSSNHRVLRYSSAAAMTQGRAAEAVFGQPDFASNTPALTQSGMHFPIAVFVDSAGRLWVADYRQSPHIAL